MYLILHIDLDFIAGVVHVSNNELYHIRKEGDEFHWLYFNNNLHDEKVTYSKENRDYFLDGEVNYYGNFFEAILKDDKFHFRIADFPIIDLLEKSDLINDLREAYFQKVISIDDKIPTLLTFSPDIGDKPKAMLVDYLKSRNFIIDSSSVSLSELICYHCAANKKFNISDGNSIILLEAVNSNLNLHEIFSYKNGFFSLAHEKYEEEGIDPRRKAIVKCVIRKINSSNHFLDEKEEKLEEKRLERYAEGWLKSLDKIKGNFPLNIKGVSFANSPANLHDVLVYRREIEEDTGVFVNKLVDIYNDFEFDCVGDHKNAGNVVVLFGDCFNNELIRNGFLRAAGNKPLVALNNRNLYNVLSSFPDIYLDNYQNEEERLNDCTAAELKKKLDREKIRKLKELEKLKSLAKLQIDSWKYDQAKKTLSDALAIDEENEDLKSMHSDLVKATDFIEHGDINFENKEYKKSEHNYQQALKYLPRDRHSLAQLKKIRIILDEIEEEKLRKKQEAYDIEIKAANEYFDYKEWEKALVSYSNAAKIFPDEEYPSERIRLCKQKILDEQPQPQPQPKLIPKPQPQPKKLWILIQKVINTGSILQKLIIAGSIFIIFFLGAVAISFLSKSGSLPEPAGPISGVVTVSTGQTDVTYSTPAITNATTYHWSLPKGATGKSSTNIIKVNFSSTAASGNISVFGKNSSGEGQSSTLAITVGEGNGSTRLEFPNGYYEGPVENGKMHGQGKFTFTKSGVISEDDPMERQAEAGDYLSGTWKNGNLLRGELFASDKRHKENLTLQ
jgi:tetratricopeptide (TPR) repeat protein